MSIEETWRRAKEVTRQHAADGRLVEVGWETLAKAIGLTDPDTDQWKEMRKAFFCGAHYIFDGVLAMTDEDSEPTENDEKRMASVHAELQRFNAELEREIGK